MPRSQKSYGLLLVAALAAIGCGDDEAVTPPPHDAAADVRPSAMPGDAGGDSGGDSAGEPVSTLRVQVFSRTTGFRHESIEPAQRALSRVAAERGDSLRLTEDPTELISGLSDTDVVVFLMTTGDVLDDGQQRAFEAYVRGGGGYVGVHSAADTEYDWPFYGELIAAWFTSHPAVMPGRVIVEAHMHPAAEFLPATWEHAEEWYDFKQNPRARAGTEIVLRVDETSYSGGQMGPDHPIAWAREIDRGRAFYTALGHPPEAWEEPLLVRHVAAAIRWAARR
jgi:type 1 glutamine amidotransferase